jgi:hypothetical protein
MLLIRSTVFAQIVVERSDQKYSVMVLLVMQGERSCDSPNRVYEAFALDESVARDLEVMTSILGSETHLLAVLEV